MGVVDSVGVNGDGGAEDGGKVGTGGDAGAEGGGKVGATGDAAADGGREVGAGDDAVAEGGGKDGIGGDAAASGISGISADCCDAEAAMPRLQPSKIHVSLKCTIYAIIIIT